MVSRPRVTVGCVCAPPVGIGHTNLLQLNVASDGTVDMLESETESFLWAGRMRVDTGDLAGTQCACRNASECRASLEKDDVHADPTTLLGKRGYGGVK